MVTYHALFDLWWFGFIGNWFWSPWLTFVARAVAIVFLSLVGIGIHLSVLKQSQLEAQKFFNRNVKRGFLFLGCAGLITFASFLFSPTEVIWFGVLHLIGTALIISPFWQRLRWKLFPLAVGLLTLGIYLHSTSWNTPWLLPFGFKQHHFQSLDYFPLAPWLGYIFFGFLLGNWLYPTAYISRLKLPDYSQKKFFLGLQWLGRHSLVIYLLHQPVLLPVIFLITYVFATVIN